MPHSNVTWEKTNLGPILLLFIWTISDILLNGLILTSVFKSRILQKKIYFLMVSLAACDFLKVLGYLLLGASILVDGKNMVVKNDLCIAASSLGFALLCSTTLHLMMESLNRLFLIYLPFKYTNMLTNKVIFLILTVIWVLPFIFVVGLPHLISKGDTVAASFNSHLFACAVTPVTYSDPTKVVEAMTPNDTVIRSNKSSESELISATFNQTRYKLLPTTLSNATNQSKNGHLTNNERYYIIIWVVFLALPMATMMICYALMFLVAVQTAKKLRSLEVPHLRSNEFLLREIDSSVSNIDISRKTAVRFAMQRNLQESGSVSSSLSSLTSTFSNTKTELKRILKARQKEVKAAKTVLLLFITFVVCNTPLFSSVWVSIKQSEDAYSKDTKLALLHLAFSQVVINPLIYFFRLEDFKSARRKVKRYGTSIIQKSIRRKPTTTTNAKVTSF